MPPLHPQAPKAPDLSELLRQARGEGRLTLKPEQQESLLSKIARSRPAGWFTNVANVLDAPGGAMRNLLTGRDPVAGFFNPSARASGRDFSVVRSLFGNNKPGLDVGDVAGFAVEVASDPLTWIGPGGFTEGGKAALKAGALGRGAFAGGKNLNTYVGRMTTTAREALAAAGKQTSHLPAHVLDQPLGGLVNVAGHSFGTGKTAQKIGGGIDRAKAAIRYGNIPGTSYSPGRHLAQAFSKEGSNEAYHRLLQEEAPRLARSHRASEAKARAFEARSAQKLTKAGYSGTPDDALHNRMIRRVFEGQEAAPHPVIKELADEQEKYMADVFGRMNQAGAKTKKFSDAPAFATPKKVTRKMAAKLESLGHSKAAIKAMSMEEVALHLDRKLNKAVQDIYKHGGAGQWAKGVEPTNVKYGPRYESIAKGKSIGNSGPLQATDPSTYNRKEFLKSIKGGTDTINKIMRSPQLNKLVDELVAGNLKFKKVLKYAKKGYGKYIPQKYVKVKGGQNFVRDRMAAIVRLMQHTPSDVRRAGFFANSPARDVAMRGLRGDRRADTAESIARVLSKAVNLPGKERVDIADLAKKLRVQPTTSGTIPRDLADEMVKYYDSWKSPEPLNRFWQGHDSLQSLFKAGVLSHPARHVRDVVSGVHRSWQAGHIPATRLPGAVADAWRSARGGIVRDVENIPVIADILKQRGIQPSSEAGMDVLRELIHAHEVVGPSQRRTAMMGEPTEKAIRNLDEIHDQLLGIKPTSLHPKDIAKKFFGQAEGTSLDLRDIQGFGGRTETKFGPVVASNDVGFHTDAINRAAPFIEQLRQGVDPVEAAARVRGAQVDYAGKAMTRFEQNVASRAIPFYRFWKGNAVSQLSELANRPGGRLAQTLRLMNNARSRDEIVPDYVNESAGVRIPENTPIIGAGPGAPPRYLTGLGLMFEDLAGLTPASPTGMLQELGSHLGPVPKFLVEATTGKSLFQRGPNGPVDIADQDPLLGRMLSNLANATGLSNRDEPVPTPQLLELLLANSPASRILSSVRTAADPRKGVGAKAANLLTGMKLTDVPEKRRDAILRQLLNEQMQAAGAKAFEKVYFPVDELEQMSPEERQAAAEATALQTLLAERAKQRAISSPAGRERATRESQAKLLKKLQTPSKKQPHGAIKKRAHKPSLR